MRTSIFFGVMLLTFAIQATTASAQNLYEYNLEKIGKKSDAAGCAAIMESVAAKFSEQSGIAPFSYGCKEDSIDRGYLDGVISYFAEARVTALSSRDRRAFIDPQGGFRSMEQCLESIGRRVAQFQAIYGVEPMAAWCYRESNYSSNYIARIDAIGESEIKSVITGFDFYGRPTIEARDILTSLKAAAELKFPGRVVDTSMESKLAYIRTTVRYYNDVRYFVDNMVEMKFRTAEVCHETLSAIEVMFETIAEKPAVLFCTVDGLAGIRVNLVTFSKNIGAPELYKHYQAPATFADRSACEANAAQITANSASVLGTICTDTTPSVLHMLLRNVQ